MKKSTVKSRLFSAVISAAMLLSAVSSPLGTTHTVLAAENGTIINSKFDDDNMLPWEISIREPAMVKDYAMDGILNVYLGNNDTAIKYGMFDMGLIHKNVTLYSGVKNHVHAEITADCSGYIYTRIGADAFGTDVWHNSMGATDDAVGYTGTKTLNDSWERLPVKGGETLVIDAEFVPEETITNGVWEFYFGGPGEFNETACFPEGTLLQFDNLILYNEIDGLQDVPSPVYEYPAMPFAINQMGYYTYNEKRAILYSDEPIKEDDFFVMDAYSNMPVYRSMLSDIYQDRESGKYVAVADFSKVMEDGRYYLSLNGTKRDSYEFALNTSVYEGLLSDTFNFFYQNRAGIPIQKQYITSAGSNDSKADLAHDTVIENPDIGYIQNAWDIGHTQNSSPVNTEIGTVEANGGWFEPESGAKSVISGAVSAWTLMNMFEMKAHNGNAWRFSRSNCEVVTPEEFDTIPDILNEVQYELNFLLSMMVPKELEYTLKPFDSSQSDTGEYANMLFHQIQYSEYVAPEDVLNVKTEKPDIKRIVKPPTTAATLAGAAVFAQAARLFGRYDEEYSKKLLLAAEAAYHAAKNNPELYAANEDAISSRSTSDDNVKDDFYWAACELYLTTQDPDYLEDLENAWEYAYHLSWNLTGGENNDEGTICSFNQGDTAGFGTLSLALNYSLIPDQHHYMEIINSIQEVADRYLIYASNNGFRVPYSGKYVLPENNDFTNDSVHINYDNCSNGLILNNAIVLAYAYDLTGEEQYYEGLLDAAAYLFGRNPMGTSYVTECGVKSVQHPVHCLWAGEQRPAVPRGIVVSGPNSALNDSYVKALGMKSGTVPPQCCYADDASAWSVNASNLDLNASLSWIIGFITEGTMPQSAEWQRGDINWDNHIGIGDVVSMQEYLRGEMTFEAEQYEAADLNMDGRVDAIDLTLLKRIVIYSNDYFYY